MLWWPRLKLPALWGATSAEGHSSLAAGVVVWRRGGSSTPLRSVPVRIGVAPESHPGRGDHARPLHVGSCSRRTCHRSSFVPSGPMSALAHRLRVYSLRSLMMPVCRKSNKTASRSYAWSSSRPRVFRCSAISGEVRTCQAYHAEPARLLRGRGRELSLTSRAIRMSRTANTARPDCPALPEDASSAWCCRHLDSDRCQAKHPNAGSVRAMHNQPGPDTARKRQNTRFTVNPATHAQTL